VVCAPACNRPSRSRISHTGGVWRGRFPQSLARRQLSPAQSEAFQRAGWLRPGQAGVILIGAVRPAHPPYPSTPLAAASTSPISLPT
jgi:hypothetical protein